MEDYPLGNRRQRQSKSIRDMFADTYISPEQLIQPYFIYEGLNKSEKIDSLRGQFKHNLDSLKKNIELGLEQKIKNILTFIVPQNKTEHDFNYKFDEDIISGIKKCFGDDINLFTDLCLCSQTLSGHCGIIKNEKIDNNSSVEALTKKAIAYARAGADVLSPSDMMDDRIASIRKALAKNSMHQKLIMSYSTKFSSNFYGPFRDAAQSTPETGDRKSYQIDYRNENDALKCSLRDAEQGADILMVKPALPYLDIIYKIKQHEKTRNFKLAAYQVSGEYQSLHLLEQAGFIDFEQALLESLYSIKRSGADLIITYAANDFLRFNYKKEI